MLIVIASRNSDKVCLTHGLSNQRIAQTGRLLIGKDKQSVVRNCSQQFVQCGGQVCSRYDTLLTHLLIGICDKGIKKT